METLQDLKEEILKELEQQKYYNNYSIIEEIKEETLYAFICYTDTMMNVYKIINNEPYDLEDYDLDDEDDFNAIFDDLQGKTSGFVSNLIEELY